MKGVKANLLLLSGCNDFEMLLLSVHILFLREKFDLYSISSELYILYQVAQMSIKNVRHLFPKNTSPETFDPFILRLNLPLLR